MAEIASEISERAIRIVVGLGNPGPQYRHTRHNIGFRALDRVAEILGAKLDREKYNGIVSETVAAGRRVLLLKPMVYMNRSGESVALAARNGVDDASEVLVLYDEIDLPLGRLRIRKQGSAGTHNGMKSVLERLGSRDVPRIRMGVGDDRRGQDLADHVLSTFRPDEREMADDLVERAARAAIWCVEKGVDSAMNEYNKRNEGDS